MSRSARPDQAVPERESTPQARAAERAARRRAAAGAGAAAGDASRPTPTAAAPDRRRRRTIWWAGLACLGLVVLLIVRLATLTPADVSLRVTAARTVRVPGSAPHPAWPTTGQAALTVEGIGSLGASGTANPTPTASLAKVMTAYLILRRYPLAPGAGGFSITVTPADAADEVADTGLDESVVAVRAGERLDERQLLEALLIPSGDNIARMLGAYAAGSDQRFVAEMNAEARRLGMTHTTYTDPSGFEPSTVSTASDQLKIFVRAMRFAAFRQIVSMPSVTLPDAGTLTNYDPLIADGYDGKTGSDSAAEGCLAFFKYETVAGRRLTVVGVVMGQGYGADTDVILGAAGQAAAALVNSVTPALRVRTILPAHSSVLVATSADGSTVRAETTRPLAVIGWGGSTERLAVTTHVMGRSLTAGASLGAVSLTGPLPEPAGSTRASPVRTTAPLGAPGLSWRLSHLL